jgi:hypothetical protein
MPSPNHLHFISGFLEIFGHQGNGVALTHTLIFGHRSTFKQHVETNKKLNQFIFLLSISNMKKTYRTIISLLAITYKDSFLTWT